MSEIDNLTKKPQIPIPLLVKIHRILEHDYASRTYTKSLILMTILIFSISNRCVTLATFFWKITLESKHFLLKFSLCYVLYSRHPTRPRCTEFTRQHQLHFQGVACSGLAFCLTSWGIQKKGPLYASVFSPFLLVIVAIFSWAFFQEKLYVGT